MCWKAKISRFFVPKTSNVTNKTFHDEAPLPLVSTRSASLNGRERIEDDGAGGGDYVNSINEQGMTQKEKEWTMTRVCVWLHVEKLKYFDITKSKKYAYVWRIQCIWSWHQLFCKVRMKPLVINKIKYICWLQLPIKLTAQRPLLELVNMAMLKVPCSFFTSCS